MEIKSSLPCNCCVALDVLYCLLCCVLCLFCFAVGCYNFHWGKKYFFVKEHKTMTGRTCRREKTGIHRRTDWSVIEKWQCPLEAKCLERKACLAFWCAGTWFLFCSPVSWIVGAALTLPRTSYFSLHLFQWILVAGLEERSRSAQVQWKKIWFLQQISVQLLKMEAFLYLFPLP